jgi:hypothetical protein
MDFVTRACQQLAHLVDSKIFLIVNKISGSHGSYQEYPLFKSVQWASDEKNF